MGIHGHIWVYMAIYGHIDAYISYGLRPLPPAPIGCWVFSEIMEASSICEGGTLVFLFTLVWVSERAALPRFWERFWTQYLYSGAPEESFLHLLIHFSDTGLPRKLQKKPLGASESFLLVFGGFCCLLKTTLASLLWFPRVLWCRSGRLGCGFV